MKRFICTAIGMCLIAVCLAGCGKNEASSVPPSSSEPQNMLGGFDGNYNNNANINAEDMPYGSNVGELTNEYDEHITIPVCYDTRYYALEKENGEYDFEELHKFHDYIVALNNKDAELMESLYYPGYLKHICEQNGFSGVEEYVENLHDSVAAKLADDFSINYIYVSNCLEVGDETADSYFAAYDEKAYEVDATLKDRITSRKLAEIGDYTCFKTESGVFQISDYMPPFVLGLYVVDGEYYLF